MPPRPATGRRANLIRLGIAVYWRTVPVAVVVTARLLKPLTINAVEYERDTCTDTELPTALLGLQLVVVMTRFVGRKYT